MIAKLIRHAQSLYLKPGEVLEVQLSPGTETPTPICIMARDRFLAKWHYLPGADESADELRFGFSDDCYLGLIHDDGVALFAFSAVGVMP